MSSFDDSSYVPPLPIIHERQKVLQALVTNIRSRLDGVIKQSNDNAKDIEGLRTDMQKLTAAVERGNRILVGLLVSAVLGSTSVTLAILLSTAKKGLHLP